MNDKQQELINIVMEGINDTLELYEKDPLHAPTAWILENWWNNLQLVFTSSSSESFEQGEQSVLGHTPS